MAIDDVMEGLNNQTDNSVFIFGKDISKIPCLRNSFLNGIYAGFGAGILSFLTTSRGLQSLNVSMISFFIVTYGYWFNCRLKFGKQEFIQRQTEGTFVDEIEEIKKRKSTS